MPEIGQTISHYQIAEKLGQGGMGEVFLAHDTSLERKVALKFLPDIFSGDPERLARFEREAKLLASLNHPNIAAIYGLEAAGGNRFLVLELVEGETLAQRIAKGPLPADEAIEVCRQITEGVEAAHEKGIIHRDLKPANVKITPEGKVKVLDFGLAKAFQGETPAADVSKSPTLTDQMTRVGVILGTAAYMSPEQAKGRPVDKRSDIWAFGCVLYECLTGKRAFEGDTISETIASILKGEPDWTALPPAASGEAKKLLRRCLAKNPGERLHDIADARILLQSVALEDAEAPQAAGPARPRWRVLPWGIALLMALIAAISVLQYLRQPEKAPLQAKRFVIPLPESMSISKILAGQMVAISPDGMQIAWVGGSPTRHLYGLRLDQFEPRTISEFKNPINPFFSPEGAWIGVFVDEKLKKVPVAGGPAEDLTDARGPDVGGGVWNSDDTIFFQIDYDQGLWRTRASASGARPKNFLKPDTANNERGLLWPQSLPSGGLLLFTAFSGDVASMNQGRIFIGRADNASSRNFLKGGMYGRYLPTGHLVYGFDGKLMAVPMDLGEQKVTGTAMTVLDSVMMNYTSGCVHFAVSDTGDLVYVPGGMQKRLDSFVLVDRKTGRGTLAEPPRSGDVSQIMDSPNVAPNGRQIAVRIAKANDDIYVFDLSANTFPRSTQERGDKWCPVWIPPEGKRLAYTLKLSQNARMFINSADGSGQPEPIFGSENSRYPCSFTLDGKTLAFVENHPKTGWDIWIGSLDGSQQAKSFLASDKSELFPTFSPDGKYIAYQSDTSGQMQVYVTRYPDKNDRVQISQDGGTEPRWDTSGKELFYRNGDQMMVAEISYTPTLQVGNRKLLFPIDRDFYAGSTTNRSYDLMPGGQEFVFIKQPQPNPITQLIVVLNWFEELKRLVPTGKK